MPQDIVLLALVFTSVAVMTGTAASMVVSRWAPERRRLQDMVRRAPAPSTTSLVMGDPYEALAWTARLRRRSSRESAKIRARLVAAGYRGDAIAVVASIEIGCAAIGGVVPLLALGFGGMGLSAVGAAAGLILPRIVLARMAERRKRVLRNGLPDALDLLVVCLDAGCTLTHAVAKVSEELRVAWPDLAHEFSLMQSEIQAGKPRVEAFQNVAERTQVDDIRPIASLLGQAERFGIGIGQALRAHADTARDKRRQRAEEQAAKAGVKIVFPLVLCIFPAFYVVTMGPVVIHFIRMFAGQTLR